MMNTIVALMMTVAVNLTGSMYTQPMTVVENNTYTNTCTMVDSTGEAWCMDYTDTVAEGQLVNVCMYNNNTAYKYDDIIVLIKPVE